MSEMMGLANRNTEITILTVSYIQESRGKQEHNLARKGRYKEDPGRISGDQ